jgi:hypothetical protein
MVPGPCLTRSPEKRPKFALEEGYVNNSNITKVTARHNSIDAQVQFSDSPSRNLVISYVVLREVFLGIVV